MGHDEGGYPKSAYRPRQHAYFLTPYHERFRLLFLLRLHLLTRYVRHRDSVFLSVLQPVYCHQYTKSVNKKLALFDYSPLFPLSILDSILFQRLRIDLIAIVPLRAYQSI